MRDLKDLSERFIADKLTPEEALQWLDEMGKPDSALPEYVDALLRAQDPQAGPDAAREERLFQKIMEKDRKQANVRRITILRRIQWSAAAALLLACTTTAYFYVERHKAQQALAHVQQTLDAPPGKAGAVLTLADGSKLTLDSMSNGTVAVQQGAPLQLQNGRLSYGAMQATASEVTYNTLSTPRGRTFQVVLPDGSKVWLNAASSIRYPTAFQGVDRTVSVTGEVYFEIAANASQPFKVQINAANTVEVLGTQFNINAYTDEAQVTTTLVQGSVRVNSDAQHAVLSPGQQALTTTDGKQAISIAPSVNIAQTLAWKEGLFNFSDMPFDVAVRQLSRWYDIDVEYENGVIPDIKFDGELGRDVSLSKILFFMTRVGVHYRVEDGKKLVITQ